MIISENQVFNLWDTNGRRSDVINALDVYLSFLLEENHREDFEWNNFPSSLSQYNFYKHAIQSSPDIFKEHPNFDYFDSAYRKEIEKYNQGLKTELVAKVKPEDIVLLDKQIEARARHYSSNLCKFGFANSKRIVSTAGKSFLGLNFKKDEIESLLPLTSANIVVLRQLLKLRVYSKNTGAQRTYYSPFKAAMYLLLQERYVIDEDMFGTIIQSMTPYNVVDIEELIADYNNKNGNIVNIEVPYPEEYLKEDKISYDLFKTQIKNSKSSKVVDIYYNFYSALYDYNNTGDESYLINALNLFNDKRTKDILKKAFGFGQNIFNDIDSEFSYGLSVFLLNNSENDLLTKAHFNKNFFSRYFKSKYLDSAREYFDTTKRMLSSTGLFRFDKAHPVLSFKDILKSIFSLDELKTSIFSTSTEEEFLLYEGNDTVDCEFLRDSSLTEILSLNDLAVNNKIASMEKAYGVQREKLNVVVKDKANSDFLEHINTKYTKDVVLTIMKLFSDRKNDRVIKQMVNPEASVPTIYEFITAIAWYYISEKQMNLFDSLNLTLNSEYEPILHAGGGDGDIIAKYQNLVVMLEVTLMDRNSQKRGELEPVLRHSTNMRAKYQGIDTLTFFIADELDQSTVITWRLAALAPREAANSIVVNNVRIMAFTNNEICSFIEKGITSSRIISETNNTFLNTDFSDGWRERVVSRIMA